MNFERAKEYMKDQLASYLETEKGLNIRKNFHCLNPEHNDGNPSMSYDKKRNKAHCFSCGADYDIFNIVGLDHNVSEFKEQYQKCLAHFGIAVEEEYNWQQQQQPKPVFQEQPVQVEEKRLNNYMSYFQLANGILSGEHGQTGLAYLNARGISKETANKHLIGFDEHWSHPDRITQGKDPIYAPMMIIPTSRHSYSVRDTRSDLNKNQMRYAKQKVGDIQFFNIKALKEDVCVFIVEGEFDALSVNEVGGTAIALGGVQNVPKLLQTIEQNRPSKPLLIALDNDEAGQRAAIQLTDGLRGLGITYFGANICFGHKDPNEALMADREQFQKRVHEEMSVEERERAKELEAYAQKSSANYVPTFLKEIKELSERDSMMTMFNRLDHALGGGLFGGLYIIGAVSSLGKTTLTLQIADQMAKMGHDILIFSLEMGQAELMAKSISRQTWLHSVNTRPETAMQYAKTSRQIMDYKQYATYNAHEQTIINNSFADYQEYGQNLFIFEGMGETGVREVRKTVEEHVRITGKRPLVIVDYLQILTPYKESVTDKQNTDKSVLELKRLARDFNIPVIGISSLSRQSYKTKISMEAFKESGAIEYGSDVLIGLQFKGQGTDSDFDIDVARTKMPREIELVVLKNRTGATGAKIDFTFNPAFNYFAETN